MKGKQEAEVRYVLATYWHLLYRTAYVFLGNEHDVADVLQEVLLKYIENPLADSFSYRVTIKLNADTKTVRHKIEQIEGVRHTLDRYELKK